MLKVYEKQKGQSGWNSEKEHRRKWGQRERVGKLRENLLASSGLCYSVRDEKP